MFRYVSARINKKRTSFLLLRNSGCVSSSEQRRHASLDSQTMTFSDPPAPALVNCNMDLHSETYLQAMERTTTQVDELNQRIAQVQQGGGAKAVERHLKRKKLLPRDRMHVLCDPGTPLLELSALAGNMDGIPSGGIVTGIGMVSGQLCMMIANDATVKGGTYFPITVKKHLRAQEIALENNLPCIYLVDSGGAFLPEQARVFPDREHFGRIFFNQANMSAQGIPQVAGKCRERKNNQSMDFMRHNTTGSYN
jgi:3-methylcrotonyl-CoA carboxylase beta subunit